MKQAQVILRTLGVLAVAAGAADQGCRQGPRGVVTLAPAGDVSAESLARLRQQIAAAAPWATVMLENDAPTVGADVTARVITGQPGPLFAALGARPADVAVASGEPSLTLDAIGLPARVMLGMRADVAVGLRGLPRGAGSVRVVLRDPRSGIEQGHVERTVSGDQPSTTVVVPWLATRVGPAQLRVDASFEPAAALAAATSGAAASTSLAVRPAPPADVTVEVQPATARVAMLEARPTWSGRFARLALAGATGVRVASEVRVAPGITVRTAPERPDSSDATDVLLVSGLEALATADVARLERDVRERGRALVLLMDDEPAPGPWSRLWPDPIGPVQRAMHPVTGAVAGHAWKMREWLAPRLSTGAASLAYFDSGSPSFVVGRAHGAGRILLVTALDAWRWRGEPATAFDAGWRALVQRLAADVPPPVAATAWTSGSGRAGTLHVDVTVRPDIAARGPLTVSVTPDPASTGPIALVPVGSGRWRGSARVASRAQTGVRVTANAGVAVVGETAAVVDVSPHEPVASWADVAQRQRERGAVAAEPERLAQALDGLRARAAPDDGRRWYITRTWWFAALALSLLGTEWILRRLHGER